MATPSESVVPAASRVRFPNTSTEARARGTSSPLTYTCTLIRISVGRWGEGSEDNKGGDIGGETFWDGSRHSAGDHVQALLSVSCALCQSQQSEGEGILARAHFHVSELSWCLE